MKCPRCNKESRVYETRQRPENTLRRRECLYCKTRFATLEVFDGMTGSRGEKKPVVKKAQPTKEKKQPVAQPKVITTPKKSLFKDELDILYKDSVNLNDFGLDVGRGWKNDEY